MLVGLKLYFPIGYCVRCVTQCWTQDTSQWAIVCQSLLAALERKMQKYQGFREMLKGQYNMFSDFCRTSSLRSIFFYP